MVAFMHTGTRLTAGYRYTTLGDATNSDSKGRSGKRKNHFEPKSKNIEKKKPNASKPTKLIPG